MDLFRKGRVKKWRICMLLLFMLQLSVFDGFAQKFKGGRQDGNVASVTDFGVKLIGPDTVCIGDRVMIDVNVKGIEIYRYEWYKGNSLLPYDSTVCEIPVAGLNHSGRYYCKVSDLEGRVVLFSDTINLVVFEKPSVSIFATKTDIARGDSVRLSAGGTASTWNWSTGQRSSSIWVKPQDTTTYRLIGTNQGRCGEEKAITINTLSLHIRPVSAVSHISRGQAVTLSAESNVTDIKWYEPSVPGLIGRGRSIVVSPDASTVYSAVATYAGVTDTAFLSVFVRGNASFHGGLNDGYMGSASDFGVKLDVSPDLSICENSNVRFSTIVKGLGEYTYQWRKIVGGSSSQLAWVGDTSAFEIPRAQLADTGRYYCMARDISGTDTVWSDTVRLQVNEMPKANIIDPASPPLICYGNTVVLKGESSVAGATVSWTGSNIIWGADSVIARVAPASTSDYIFRVHNNGCIDDTIVRVTVNSAYVDIPAQITVTAGSEVGVTASDKNGNAITAGYFSWNGGSFGNSNSFSLPSVSANTTIHLEYKSVSGCPASDSTKIFVKGVVAFRGGSNDGYMGSISDFGVKLNVSPDLSVCENSNVGLSTIVKGLGAYTYQWWKIVGGSSSQLAWVGDTSAFEIPRVQLADAGLYYCMVRDISGTDTVWSDTVRLQVNEMPKANIIDPASPPSICYGDSIQLRGTSSVAGATVSWTGSNIIWGADSVIARVAPVSTSNYVFRVNNKGCTDDTIVHIIVNSAYVDIPPQITVTAGSRVDVTASDKDGNAITAGRFSWNGGSFGNSNSFSLPSVSANTTIHLEYKSISGCPASDSTKIFVKGAAAFRGGRNDGYSGACLPPVILKQPEAAGQTCVSASKSLRLEVVAEGTDIRYRWEKFDNDTYAFKPYIPSNSQISGEKSPVLDFRDLSDSDNGAYRCVLENDCSDGEVISDTCYVSAKGEPVIKSGINVDRDRCAGSGDFTFNVIAKNAVGNGELTYRWYKDGNLIPGADRNFYKVTIGPGAGGMAAEGVYVVVVANECGSVSDTAFLPVIVPPVIKSATLNVTACQGGDAVFSVITNQDGRYRYALYELTNYPALDPQRLVADGSSNKITLYGVTTDKNYRMKVYHAYCDSAAYSAPMTLRVEKPVTITASPRDTVLCAGEPFTLHCAARAGNTSSINYQWYRNGVLYGSVSTVGDLVIPHMPPNDVNPSVYQCLVWNSCTPAWSTPANVTVKIPPVISSGPEVLDEYCEGDSVRLTVHLNTSLATVDSVRWFCDGQPVYDKPGLVSGSNTLTLVLDSVNRSQSNVRFYMKAYNSCNPPAESRKVSFAVLEPARFVMGLDGAKLVMCDGEDQELIVQATGTPSLKYIWLQNNLVIAEGYSNRLKVSGKQINERDLFTCHVQNACGDQLTTAPILVSRSKLFTFEGDGHYCDNDGIGVTAWLRGSDTITDYQLYRKNPKTLIDEIAGNTVTASDRQIAFEKLTAGTYYVLGIDTNDCPTPMPGEAVVTALPQPKNQEFFIKRHLCENATDADICLGGSETGVNYVLKYAGNEHDPWVAIDTVSGTGDTLNWTVRAGMYKISAENVVTGCKREFSSLVNVIERPLPKDYRLNFDRNDSIYCKGGLSDVTLLCSSFEAGSRYQLKRYGSDYRTAINTAPVQWENVTVGTYSLLVTNKWGCKASFGNRTVNDRDPAGDLQQPYELSGEAVFCQNDTDSCLIELANSAQGVRYSFRYLPSSVYKDTVSTGGAIRLKVPKVDREYYVIATDTTPEHCSMAMLDTISISESKLAVTTVSPVRTAAGDSVQLQATATGAVGKARFEWTPKNLLVFGQDTANNPYTLPLTSATKFDVVVNDQSGCPAYGEVEVNLCDDATSPRRFQVENRMYCAGDSARLSIPDPEAEVSYKLYVHPADTLVKNGWLQAGQVVFGGVAQGDYHIRAFRGLCTRDTLISVDSMPTPLLPDREVSTCVDRDSGQIRLKGLTADIRYMLGNRIVEKFAGDTTFSRLPVGVYTLQAEDTLSGCKSVVVVDTIMEGVYADSLVPPFEYCAGSSGVELRLSGVHMSIKYSILAENGSTIDFLRYPQQKFVRPQQTGRYIFRKEREGIFPGCVENTIFSITPRPLPVTTLAVSVIGTAPVCDGGKYQIKIESTEPGMRYILQRTTVPAGNLDTLYGDGTAQTFDDSVSVAGKYRIAVNDTIIGCTEWLDTVLVVHPRPSVTVTDSSYCDFPGLKPGIEISGMQPKVSYALWWNGHEIDKISGTGSGRFAHQSARLYNIILTDSITGCKRSLPVEVIKKDAPELFAVVHDCQPGPAIVNLVTTGSDTADAIYSLYRDGVAYNPAMEKPGTGNQLVFGPLTTVGTYKVRVEKPSSGCDAFLTDSVMIYPALGACDTLIVLGQFCASDTGAGVTLRYPCPVEGWKYYITNNTLYSDTLSSHGSALTWDRLRNIPAPSLLRGGTYFLRAIDPCGITRSLDSAIVVPRAEPVKYAVVDKPAAVCSGQPFTIAIVNSDTSVNYFVRRYSSGIPQQTYPKVRGVGDTLVLGTFSTAGEYEVMADNGCPVQLDRWTVEAGRMPQEKHLLGTDVCKAGATDSIRLSVDSRESGVAYYLFRNDGNMSVDSLTSAYHPAPRLNFETRPEVGCYTAMAVHESSGCRRDLPGRFCMNTVPDSLFPVETIPGLDTLRVCQGADTSIYLTDSKTGVLYGLMLDGAKIEERVGHGQRLEMGKITASGVYRVKALVCDVWMPDSVIVEVNPLPTLQIADSSHYCYGGADTVRVAALTRSSWMYELYAPDLTLLESRLGEPDQAGFKFNTGIRGNGYHRVKVTDRNTTCSLTDSIKIVRDPQPAVFEPLLSSSENGYICADGFVTIGISGSEKGVTYTLLKGGIDVSQKEGTGSAMNFSKQVKEAGTYYVNARYKHGLGCNTDFGSLTLQLAPPITPYRVESVVNSYCYTSPADVPRGKIRLSGSQVGVVYDLLCDGNVVEGRTQTGTGGPLVWSSLYGKPCDDGAAVDGYIYRVVGRDPVTACRQYMSGSDTIVAASPLRILAQEPGESRIEKCEGSEIKLNLTVSGCRATYTWRRFGAVVKSGKEPYYNIASALPVDYGEYRCEITNSCGTIFSPIVDLTIRELVKLEEPMEDENLCGEVTKNAMLSSGFKNAEEYRWYKLPDRTTVVGSRNFYEILDVQPADSGTYVVVADNRCKSPVSDTVKLSIGVLPVLSISSLHIDTLCRGSFYETVPVTANVPFLSWYLNGGPLAYTGKQYRISNVSSADQGEYSVRAVNGCGEAVLHVATLYVDDTLRVESVTDGTPLRCAGTTEELYIDVRPSERVTYLWEDKNMQAVGHGNKLPVGPFVENDFQSYRIWYFNKCSVGSANYRDIVISVPERISITDPPRSIELCADCLTDTVLRLGVSPAAMAQFEWYYREKKDDQNRLKISTADSVRIGNCTGNTGYYYCKAFNRCDEKTTETTWLRIDSVPVIRTSLENDTLCEGGWTSITLSATGGGVQYNWRILKKDGTLRKDSCQRGDYESWGELLISNLDSSYDSCRIWCQVVNACGMAQSDTMILRLNKRRELKVQPSSVTICSGDPADVVLTMENGVLPWKYRYTIGDATTVYEVTESVWMQDTLTVTKPGSYRITYFEDAVGCIRTTGLPSFQVVERSKSTAKISGGGEVCIGAEVSVRVSVTDGVGPWKVYLYRLDDGQPADDLPVSCPMNLPAGKRDSTFKLTAVEARTYYIESVLDAASCEGLITRDSAVVKVNQKLNVRLTPLTDNHFGICNPINLFHTLKPFIENADRTKTYLDENAGTFYVDSNALSNNWWVAEKLTKGKHTIKYVYASDTCSISPIAEVIVDTIPSGVIDLPGYVCRDGGSAEMKLTLSGARPFKIDIQKVYVEYGGIPGSPDHRFGVSVTNNSYVENPVSFFPTDSCVFYTINNITDKHGCKSDQILKDTLIQGVQSEFNVEVRYPNREGVVWQPALLVYNIPAGDSLGVRFTQTAGNGYPWQVMILDNANDSVLLADLKIHRQDTVISLKKTCTYKILSSNSICGQSVDGKYLVLNHMDTGYIRAKVLLEGACTSAGRMSSAIEAKLPRYGLADFPANVRGRVIDWIEVEVRSNTGGLHSADSAALLHPGVAVLCRDTCLVLDDGTIVDRTGNDTIALPHCCISGSNANNCFITLRHRNHLAVMTADAWRIVDRNSLNNVRTIDFTRAANIYKSGTIASHMTEVLLGVWAMSAGEVNTNALISIRDPNIEVVGQESALGYYLYDVNFDGQVNWPGWNQDNGVDIDWLMVARNRNKFSEIRFNP